ncbi:MAG TPA: 4Fe-4S dicluster domain-containing protein [Alphaproteobacteria bacterium]|nr:4Fe-4S dicluster domain-containing protein [Alphaproteobacteria bacterium]
MKVLINHKICDMSPSCGGIDVCPTGALFWDKKNGRIGHNESKCIGCGACEKACPVAMAIRLARTPDEEKEIQAEYDSDPRCAEDLFIDRYGGDFVFIKNTNSEKALEIANKTSGLVVMELNSEDFIRCLIISIPVKEILKEKKSKYIKVMNPSDKLLKKFELTEVPALIFFQDGKLIGKVEGYFENTYTEKGLLLRKVEKIINLANNY